MSKREALAAYSHDEAWSGWMKYFFSKCEGGGTVDGIEPISVTIPPELVERWQRQMKTPYALLPEAEKESDRAEADKMLAIVRGTCYCGCHACKYCEQLLESEASRP